jgi:nucleotide-binding universal stress UspA family protein
MRAIPVRAGLIPFAGWMVGATLMSCVAFEPVTQSTVEDMQERPFVAILPFAFDIEITTLSALKTVDETLSPEDETKQVAETLKEVQQEARWLLLSRLATGEGFRFVPLVETDALAEELQLTPGVLPNAEQLREFRRRLGADLVVAGSILDYGKVRWQWLAAGMFADIAWETAAIGVATAWNPGIILGNVGFELLTSTPLWFGGGYVFGIALRPVRVEARAFETVHGYPIWQAMDESAYARSALKTLPEAVRGKKESQLALNLAEIMESLGDDLIKQSFMASRFREHSVPAGWEQY